MERSRSIEHCGKVLFAVKVCQEFPQFANGEKVPTEVIALTAGLTEKQVTAAIETMTRGKHPQVDGDRFGVWRINDISRTF